MPENKLHQTVAVRVGDMTIGGGNPVVIQSMTNTETSDVAATARQCIELAMAGSELVRLTVNSEEAARAVPEIRKRMNDTGYGAPLIGDFHYNGHTLLAEYPDCAAVLDKYRINPGNVGKGKGHDDNFSTICKIAADNGKAVRIGVNAGSLDSELVKKKMGENSLQNLGKSPGEIQNQCMVLSAVRSTEKAIEAGLGQDRIILSCKTSRPMELVSLYRNLASRTKQPLHLGLTEAGMGLKGLVWSSAAMSLLLAESIGDTIRISLTPSPASDRREEVYACIELLQALDLRRFSPTVTSCPGCGRTTSDTFQRLAESVQSFIRERLPEWKKKHPGVETMTVAVMGCVVNGPGESRSADVGISLPGTGEEPKCPVFVRGKLLKTLKGNYGKLSADFEKILENFVRENYPATG